ncbi:PREDICTED: uncharacterized protein LOC109206485 [Nicotiana attenuata]|uniref:Uncharacterized protein n=1 Tax=Nicotiana attenuata TaxID=49451 RepID=A0A314KUP2_NICAT|nr:PREDICTED: uncharacterized protein LOC109206485 [Nicotiana attenuata]OIT33063.1 hypothetical protein A4A49_16739 [Nicotiana attenuata]
MSLSIVERSLFNDKDGGATIVKHRFLGFLIWQALQSTAVFFLSKTLLLSLFTPTPFKPSFLSLFAFIVFHFSLLFFSTSLFIISSPRPHRAASPLELLLGSVKLILVPISSSQPLLSSDFRLRARVSLSYVLFVAVSAVSASLSMISLCWSCGAFDQVKTRRLVIGKLGFWGLQLGMFYAVHYVYKKRWVLQFPIIQRPPFFSFKMGLPLAVGKALKLSAVGYVFSALLAVFLPYEFKGQLPVGNFITEQIIFYIGSFVVILCWELSHHLHQVLHTKRSVFAPPKGSAAAETNPSEPLLASLEESTPKSLLQYLAYLDLCMVCESNVDPWRRAAFFEESGETYKRVISVCLTPVEQFTRNISEVLESSPVDNSLQLSRQLRSPNEQLADSKIYESFDDFQLLAWCARIVASLTVHSHKEDRFGVAQLSGSNAAVLSTLLSSLLVVETLMGKKTNLPSSNSVMDPAGIKWATLNSGRRDSAAGVAGKRKGAPFYAKAYSMADILRTSIYCIVSAFYDEMSHGAKAGLLEKDWIISSKPLYGTRELLSQKLRLFLDYQAT